MSTESIFMPSILDTDLYKLTMQQAVLHHFPNNRVQYKFYNRRPENKFTRPAFDALQIAIKQLASLSLTAGERVWLESRCPYFTERYLDYLASLRLDPQEQVVVGFVPTGQNEAGEQLGDLELLVKGTWLECILYEVPLMALISETYFAHVDTDWSIETSKQDAKEKAKKYISQSIAFAEFGTRRRRSYRVHDIVIEGLIEAHQEMLGTDGSKRGGRLAGTSNVHFAQKYNLAPVGTIAHEWTMGIAALKGYGRANANALDLWEQVYPPSPTSPLHIALTDTFSTAQFLDPSTFTLERARAWKGLRQDSGDPFIYAKTAVQAYRSLGIDPAQEGKVLVFSDGLNDEMPARIKQNCDELGILASFGIGTHLTNDFVSKIDPSKTSQALNIVIKLSVIDGMDCVKISDELSKNTGNPETIALVKEELQLIK